MTNGRRRRPHRAGPAGGGRAAQLDRHDERPAAAHRASGWPWQAAVRWAPSTRSARCARSKSRSHGLDLTDCHGYVGVSAGGFIAASLANGISPRELCRAFIENEGDADDILHPDTLMRPAWGEFARRLATVPALVAQAAWRYVFHRRSLLSAFERLGRALPSGLFSNHLLERQMRRVFSAPGRSNDFRQLRRKLVLVATDLDTGEAAPFGQPGWDHVPISRAIQASAALPGLFPPVEIDGRHYVDGALKKTLHASVLLDEGLDLLICLNPLVPFDASAAPRHRVMSSGEERIPRLVDGGLPVVLSQTFRSLIHSRLELGMKGYERSHPDTTILLFEPDHARRRAVPRQHLQLLAAPRAGRACLPADARACCARAARRWRSNSRSTACAWTTRCSTTRIARCLAGARRRGCVRRARCGAWRKC